MKSKSFDIKFLLQITMLFIFFVVGVLFLTACGEGNPADETYKIYAPTAENDEYIIEGLPAESKPYQTIKFTVIITKTEYELISVKNNGKELYGIGEEYSFYMSENDAYITVETAHIQEITTSNYVIFNHKNNTQIATEGDGDLSWVYRKLYVDFLNPVRTNNVLVDFTSTNENVIPLDALGFEEEEIGNTGLANTGYITIDQSKISVGSTYLKMKFKDNDTSKTATLIIKIEVVAYGEVGCPTMTETLSIDFSDFDAGTTFTLRLWDSDYNGETGGNFKDYYLTKVDNAITFDYRKYHSYSMAICVGNSYDNTKTYKIGEKILGGGSSTTGFDGYQNGSLTFINPDKNLELIVYNEQN